MTAKPNASAPRLMANFAVAVPAMSFELPAAYWPPADTAAEVESTPTSFGFSTSAAFCCLTASASSAGGVPVVWALAEADSDSATASTAEERIQLRKGARIRGTYRAGVLVEKRDVSGYRGDDPPSCVRRAPGPKTS